MLGGKRSGPSVLKERFTRGALRLREKLGDEDCGQVAENELPRKDTEYHRKVNGRINSV
jgi:hypothetical protein